ncbi:NifU family protein [Pelosinus propionicus]|nr:NifU family protein [Pelosinus propionicus]
MQNNKERFAELEIMIQNEIRPFLKSHDGDIQLVNWEDNGTVTLRLLGACANCPSSEQTLSSLVEKKLKNCCPDVKQVNLVQQVSETLIKQALQILRREKTSDE